jgi:coatomer subunit beta
MTGLADSVYIEGFIRLHSFDLILELSIVNRTAETLQNILVELCTNGDLKVVDKPEAVTLAPGESKTVFATIRVSSTENGTIFGYATLDRKSALDKEWIVLNEIHADVVDYIIPHCAIMESAFKNMWLEFEWENKIVVHTDTFGSSATAFVDALCSRTNLEFVGTADQVKAARHLLEKSAKFVAVNLYAKSIFGEDALVNVSLEGGSNGQLNGTVRIRARTQGIALSIGDKVNQIQKEHVRRGA